MPRVFWAFLLLAPLAYTTAYPNFDVVRLPWTTIATVGLCIGWLVAGKRKEPQSPIHPRLASAVGAFFIVQILSSLRALNPGEGSEQISRDLSAAAAFFLIAAGPFPSDMVLRFIPLGVALAGGLVGLVGLGQRIGIHLPWIAPQELLISTLGNPNYAGPLVAMTLPLTLCLLIDKSFMRLRVGLVVTASVQMMYCAIAGSRAAWLGLLFGLLVGAGILWRRPETPRRYLIMAGGALVLLLGAGLFLGVRPSSEEITRITRPGYWTNYVRLGMWKETVKAIPEAPIAGQGGTNFKHWYGRHRSDEEVRLHSANLSPRLIPDMDNSHNGHLQLVVESGLIGFAAWVLVLIMILRRASRPMDWIRVGALGSFSVFLVCDFFNSLHMHSAHWTLFWIAAGLLVWREPDKESSRPGWVWAVVMIACLVQAFLLSGQVRSVLAYDAYRRSFQEKAIVQRLEEAVDLDPYSVTIRHELGLVYLQLRQKERAREQFETILKTNPEAPTAQLGLAFCDLDLGRAAEGEARLKSLTGKLPGWPWPWERLGALELRRKNFTGALVYFDRAIEARSDFGEARARRGIALAQLGRVSEAAEEFRRAAEGKFSCRVGDLPAPETAEIRSIPGLAPFFKP